MIVEMGKKDLRRVVKAVAGQRQKPLLPPPRGVGVVFLTSLFTLVGGGLEASKASSLMLGNAAYCTTWAGIPLLLFVSHQIPALLQKADECLPHVGDYAFE